MTAIKNVGKHKLHALMRKHYANMTDKDLAKKFGVTIGAIDYAQRTLKLRKSAEHRESVMRALLATRGSWTHEMVEILALMYPVMRTKEIAELFGLSASAVQQKARSLGMKKQPKTPEERALQAKKMKALRDKRHRPARPPRAARPKPEKPQKIVKPPKPKPAPVPRRPADAAPAKLPVGPKLPPPMTPAMLARMQKERFNYPEGLPWRAQQRMHGPSYVPTGMEYRGQVAR